MSRFIAVLGMLLLAYAAAYAPIRIWNHCPRVSSFRQASGWTVAPAGGTRIFVPACGIARPLKRALYLCFLPLGRIDQAITGAWYYSVDQRRDVIY
jgi:hypothetical protein